MPELPEVENVVRALRRHLPGRQVTRVEIFSPAMREPLAPLTTAELPGRTVTDVRRRGRYILIDLDDGRLLLAHLGMSGVIRLESSEVRRRKHEHVFIHFSGNVVFRFECARRFSVLKVCVPERPGGEPPELARLGAEPLSDAFTGGYLFDRSRGRAAPVKVFLMDNAIVTGIGNIYAAESLFAAGVHPARAAGSLTREECGALVVAIRRVLRDAIDAGGTTFHDYRHVDGTEGKFKRNLRVYGRVGLTCVNCGEVIVSVRLGGRSSAFCPRCQRMEGRSRRATARKAARPPSGTR